MKRYTIIDKDPLSISIDGHVRLEDPDTGASVANVFVDCEEPKNEDDLETPMTPESARRLRQLQCAPEMEEALRLCRRELGVMLEINPDRRGGGYEEAYDAAKRVLNYIETGEEE